MVGRSVTLDQLGRIRPPSEQVRPGAELEVLLPVPRRHGRAEQRPVAERLDRLPAASPYQHLRPLAGGEVGPEDRRLDLASWRKHHHPRRVAGVEMEHLRSGQAVEHGRRRALDQEVDRGRDAVIQVVAEHASFAGQRLEAEQLDHLLGGQGIALGRGPGIWRKARRSTRRSRPE